MGTVGNQPPVVQDDCTFRYMRQSRRWLLWKEIPNASNPKPDKVPYYVSGKTRGATDTQEDLAQLATYDEACRAFANGGYTGLAFALGPDGAGGYWQGVDLDNVKANELDDLADTAPGHVELSPSGNGCHAIGYGAYFPALGSNGTGVEAYSVGRYFTFTGRTIRDGTLTCLAAWVNGPIAARHGAARPTASATGSVYVDPKTVTELRSALNAIPADDYHVWVRMGCALHELGGVGRELWLTWSQSSDKWKPADAKKWDTFRSDRTGHKAVFAEAQRYGYWVNPGSNAAQIPVAPVAGFAFKFARIGDSAVEVTYLVDPWIPHCEAVGCWGRGEAGKSSWCAQMAAHSSSVVSTLWITSEEPESHIRVRHTACGGEDATLAVNVAIPTEIDPKTGKAVATSFNVYEHLEPAIEAFKRDPEARPDRPLARIAHRFDG